MSTNRKSSISRPTSLPRTSQISRPSSVTRLVPSRGFTPSSATRSSSVTRASVRDTFGRSSSGLRRYGSDNYLNNTPNRFSQLTHTPLGRSPAVRHSVMPPDSTRKSKHENVVKVQEILQRDEGFYAELNLKNGLKSMTINQFYMIMKRFVRLASGKELDAFMNGGDPINGILNFMTQAEYPFTINKSMLKTPNAPHTFDQVVLMLLWLGNISGVSAAAADDELMDKYLYRKDEHFPNEEFTATFSKAAQEGYILWNNESDEHTKFVDELVDRLIAEKLNHKVSSAAELKALTNKLEIKSKELMDNPVPLNNVHQFEELESKYIEYETKEHDLMNQIKEKRDRLAAVCVNWNDKRTKVQHSQTKVNDLAIQIKNQKYSLAEYKKLGEHVSAMKSAVATIRDEIKSIRDEESNQKITQARLLKKVSEAITKFNDRGIKIIKILSDSGLTMDKRDLNRLHLPPNPSIQHVQEVEEMLAQVFSAVKLQLKMDLDQANCKLNILKAESESLAKDFEDAKKKYDKIVFENEVLEKMSAMKNKKSKNCTHKLTQQAEDSKVKLQALKAEIAKAHEKKNKLEAEVARLLNDGEAEAMRIIGDKQKLINQMGEIDKMLDMSLEGLDYPK